MENKLTFTKAEIMILVGGVAGAWDSINEDQENYDSELTKKVESIFEGTFKPNGDLVDEKLEEELNKDETFANLLHKVIDVYNKGE